MSRAPQMNCEACGQQVTPHESVALENAEDNEASRHPLVILCMDCVDRFQKELDLVIEGAAMEPENLKIVADWARQQREGNACAVCGSKVTDPPLQYAGDMSQKIAICFDCESRFEKDSGIPIDSNVLAPYKFGPLERWVKAEAKKNEQRALRECLRGLRDAVNEISGQWTESIANRMQEADKLLG